MAKHIALLVCARQRSRATGLLEGLAREPRRAAVELVLELAEVASSIRQARVTRAFGWRDDAAERLFSLVARSSPRLAREISDGAPAPWRRHLPDVVQPSECGHSAPMLRALAARLQLEAVR